MNEISPLPSNAQEIGKIRAVVEQATFPDFVDGFEVKLGEFDGEPAMWIIFHTTGGRPVKLNERRERVEKLRQLKDTVHRELITTFADRYPYYQFANGEQSVPRR